MNLFLIGGGNREPIFREAATELEAPDVLIVPSACSTEGSYNNKVNANTQLFKNLGLAVSVLHRFEEVPSKDEIDEKFGKSSLIYVTGGNSPHLRNTLNAHGTDTKLVDEIKAGKLYVGSSAGALAVFQEAHVCPAKNPSKELWDYELLTMLGILGSVATAHANGRDKTRSATRLAYFMQNFPDRYYVGFGIDSGAALVVNGVHSRVARTESPSSVHAVYHSEDGARSYDIRDDEQLTEIINSLPNAA